eukprot:g17672.t1
MASITMAADSFGFTRPAEGRMLLVFMDAHSKWPEVAVMKLVSVGATIDQLDEIFARFGNPEHVVSDNGPQFVAQESEEYLNNHRGSFYDKSSLRTKSTSRLKTESSC